VTSSCSDASCVKFEVVISHGSHTTVSSAAHYAPFLIRVSAGGNVESAGSSTFNEFAFLCVNGGDFECEQVVLLAEKLQQIDVERKNRRSAAKS
jgi:hypothetical protein